MDNKKTKGRPEVVVNWPENQFTAEEIYNALDGRLSRVSVHAKINKAVSSGQLERIGKIKPKTGRPKILYRKRAETNEETTSVL